MYLAVGVGSANYRQDADAHDVYQFMSDTTWVTRVRQIRKVLDQFG